jgi:hypothetical protein
MFLVNYGFLPYNNIWQNTNHSIFDVTDIAKYISEFV